MGVGVLVRRQGRLRRRWLEEEGPCMALVACADKTAHLAGQ